LFYVNNQEAVRQEIEIVMLTMNEATLRVSIERLFTGVLE
jgi:hypothetical protein